jgi:acyl carrier protein
MTAHRQIESGIRAILVRRLRVARVDTDAITSETPILGRGVGLDSLEALALVTEIEAQFGVLFGDEELTEDLFRDVGTLTARVSGKLSELARGTDG